MQTLDSQLTFPSARIWFLLNCKSIQLTQKTLTHLVVLVTMTRGVMVLLFACMLIVITARVSVTTHTVAWNTQAVGVTEFFSRFFEFS